MNLKNIGLIAGFVMSAGTVFAQGQGFLDDLNACLSRSELSIESCARMAAITDGSQRLEINEKITLDGDTSLSREVKKCGVTGAGEKFCEVYECSNDGVQSICNQIAFCIENGGLAQSYCN